MGYTEIPLQNPPRNPATGAARLLPILLYGNELIPVYAIDRFVGQAILEGLGWSDKGLRKIVREMGVGVGVERKVAAMK